MSGESARGWDRREFLGAASLLAMTIGVPVTGVRASNLDPDSAPSEAQRALFREASQLVVPRTQTAGAGEVGVGDFVLMALAHGLEGSRKPVPPAFARWQRADGTLDYPGWLENALAVRASGNFMAAPAAMRSAALAGIDAEAFEPGVKFHPWRTLKALILTGYYTSQTGGAEELRYEPVPGRWEPDLPQDAWTRAISNDWTAVDFG